MVIIFLTIFIDLLGFGIIIPLNPYLASQFGADALTTGALMSIYSVMQFVFAPFWGRISDRRGRRPVILICLLGMTAAHLLFACSNSLLMLFVARALAGFFGANISSAMAYIADITDSKDRAKGMGIIGAAFGLGFVFGPFVGGIFGEWGTHLGSTPPLGESFAALMAAAISLCNFVFAYFKLKESLPVEKRNDLPPREAKWKSLFRLGHSPLITILTFVYFFSIFGMANMETSLFLYLRDQFAWTLKQSSWGFAYVGVVIVITQGYILRKVVKSFKEVNLIIVGLIAAALGLGFMGIANSNFGLWLAVTLIGVGTGIANPSLTGLISILTSEKEQGEVMGTSQSYSSLGRILGPAIGGLCYRDYGRGSPFFLGAIIMVVGILMVSAKFAPLASASKK